MHIVQIGKFYNIVIIILYVFNIYYYKISNNQKQKEKKMSNQTNKKKSKAVTFTLNDETLKMLAELAEKNSNSQSYEVRRLIKDEYNKQYITK